MPRSGSILISGVITVIGLRLKDSRFRIALERVAVAGGQSFLDIGTMLVEDLKSYLLMASANTSEVLFGLIMIAAVIGP